MKYSCIIVDDEPNARKLLEGYTQKTPYLELRGMFKNAFEVLDFLRQNQVDLIFWDIKMPQLKGLNWPKSSNRKPL